MAGLLYARQQQINEHFSVHVPSVGEIYDNEDAYYDVVCSIVSTPYDMMVQLDDAGIAFTKINDFDLFCLMFPRLQEIDTSLVFGDTDLRGFKAAVNQQNGNIVLVDDASDAVIDRAIHDEIAKFLRMILHIEKNEKRPANEEARKYMIERARKKQSRMKKKKESGLEDFIVALVNNADFPYNYETVRDISIYQFYSSLHQISHKIKFSNTMIGYYAGTVKFEDLNPKDRSWIFNQ